VADLLLPHLHDRPLTMKRMPDGLAGEPFYEKQVPAHAPDWLPTAAVPTEEDSRVVEFVLAQDRASLLYVVNLGCIEMHPLHSRAGSLDRPDYAFFDLDPFEPYTYEDVRTVAKLVKVVLDGLGLRGYAKTSGATGMQVFVPLDGTHTHSRRPRVRRAGGPAGRPRLPGEGHHGLAGRRPGGQDLHRPPDEPAGANIASVYSLRPLPGAPVSTPLDWDELDDDIEPNDFRIDNVWDPLRRGRPLPLRPGRQAVPDPRPWRPSASPPAHPKSPRGRSRPRFPAKRATRPVQPRHPRRVRGQTRLRPHPGAVGRPGPPSSAGRSRTSTSGGRSPNLHPRPRSTNSPRDPIRPG
jgi:bifunctional non-homologous end joining protein LigD